MSAQIQCSVNKELENLAKRSPNYFQDAVPLCDSYLKKGWYVAIHHDMPTTAPDLGYCGTTFPYWLDGNDISNINIKHFFIFFLQNILRTFCICLQICFILLFCIVLFSSFLKIRCRMYHDSQNG